MWHSSILLELNKTFLQKRVASRINLNLRTIRLKESFIPSSLRFPSIKKGKIIVFPKIPDRMFFGTVNENYSFLSKSAVEEFAFHTGEIYLTLALSLLFRKTFLLGSISAVLPKIVI